MQRCGSCRARDVRAVASEGGVGGACWAPLNGRMVALSICDPRGVGCCGWHWALEVGFTTYDVWVAHPCSSHSDVFSLPCMVGGDGVVVVQCLRVRQFVGTHGGRVVRFLFGRS